MVIDRITRGLRRRAMISSTSMTMRYSMPYFFFNTEVGLEAASPVTMVAEPVTATASSGTDPRRLHGRSSTRSEFLMRLTLPLSAGVMTTRLSPSRAIHTGVDTGAPDRRKVVSETNASSPRARASFEVVAMSTKLRTLLASSP